MLDNALKSILMIFDCRNTQLKLQVQSKVITSKFTISTDSPHVEIFAVCDFFPKQFEFSNPQQI